MAKPKGQNTPPGPAVDASGQAVIDPTANVKDIVEAVKDVIKAESRRHDGLRKADRRLRKAELHGIRREMKISARYERQLSKSETKRINAIRAVDVGAGLAATAAADQRALTLAKQVADSAEALRKAVEAAALASENRLTAVTAPIAAALAEVQRVQYQQAGQQSAGDDPIVKAIAELRNFMIETQTQRTSQGEQRSSTNDSRNLWFGVFGVLGIAVVAISPHIH